LADRGDLGAATSLLTEIRSNVIRLGDPHTSAALHIMVAEIEAKRGLPESARRHTRTASSLLLLEPNVWLQAWSENINVAIAIISSNIDEGLLKAENALRLAEEAGAAATLRACLANFGNLLMLVGRFDEAINYFERAITTLPAFGDSGNGAIDAIASTRLTQGLIDEASELLDRIEQCIKNQADRKLYVYRHSMFTRIRAFILAGAWQKAFETSNALLELARDANDHLLQVMVTLQQAEIALHTSSVEESVRLISPIASELSKLPSEFSGHYEAALAAALLVTGEGSVAKAHIDRAKTIFTSLRNTPCLVDLDRQIASASSLFNSSQEATSNHPTQSSDVTFVVQQVAAMITNRRPTDLLALSVMELLKVTGCITGAHVRISQTVQPIAPNHDSSSEVLVVGTDKAGQLVHIAAELKPDTESTATFNAIRILVAAIQDLERAQTEREERLALWPIEDLPVDGDQTVILGRMRELMTLARRVATTNVSVLITGESGTGKEILARAIHRFSARADKPFVPFNCTAVPRELLESQLFGYRRGAFTGAERDHLGLIRAAKDGTLFLDEIGELGLDLQPKLLRFLESGEINPLGEPSPFNVNVRILAATNRDLEELVQEGRFREDLFYRLNVVRLAIPPLRERRDEIPALVHHLTARAASEFGKGRVRVAEDTMEHLLLYSWPGNVRQLQNELRRMVALADNDSVLTPDVLSTEIRRATTLRHHANGTEIAVPLTDKLTPTISRIEREMIRLALRTHHGRVEAAARALGISRKGLYLKRQRLGL